MLFYLSGKRPEVVGMSGRCAFIARAICQIATAISCWVIVDKPLQALTDLSGEYQYVIEGTAISGKAHMPQLFAQAGIFPNGKTVVLKRNFVLGELPPAPFCLSLGEIRSADRVFINNVLTGQTGAFSPNYIEVYDRERCYPIDKSILKAGLNSIRIEIFSPAGQRQGGILAKKICFRNILEIATEFSGKLALGAALVSLLFFSALFFLMAAFIFRYESALVIGLLNTAFASYLFFSGQTKYILGENLLLLKRFEYSLLAIIPVFFFQLIAAKSNDKALIIVRIFQAANLFFLTAFLSSRDLTTMLDYLYLWQQSLPMQLAGIIIITFMRKNKTVGRRMSSVLSYLVLGIAGVIDIAGLRNYHTLPKLMPFAALLFFNVFLGRALADIRKNILTEKQNRLFVSRLLELSGSTEIYAVFCDNLYRTLNHFFPFSAAYCEVTDPFEQTFSNGHSQPNSQQSELLVSDQPRGKIIWGDNSLLGTTIADIVKVFAENEIRNLDNRNRMYRRQLTEKAQLKFEKFLESRKRKELDRLNKLRADLFAGFSHDIRTPLSMLTIPVNVLEGKVRNNKKLATLAASLKKGIYSLLKSVNLMLDTVQSVKNQDRVENKVFDLKLFLEHLAGICRPLFLARKGNLRLILPSQPLVVRLDPEKLERILLNLISNSYKYAPRSRYLDIQVSVHLSRLRIHVTDYGPGIPEPVLRRLKQKGQNRDNLSSAQGSGLGLTLAMAHVHSLKGRLSYKKSPKKFSAIVELPLNLVPGPRNNTPEEYSFHWSKLEKDILTHTAQHR